MTHREKLLWELIDMLVEDGKPMSNWMYNKSQAFNFAVYKTDMQAMVRSWDAATSRVHSAKEASK